MNTEKTKLEINRYLDSLPPRTPYIWYKNCLYDFKIYLPGKILWIKVKGKVTDKLTPAEENFRTEHSRDGDLYYLVVFSFRDFLCNLEHVKRGTIWKMEAK